MQETWQKLRVGWAGVSEWFRGFPDWSWLGLVILAANRVGLSCALELLLLLSAAASFTTQFLLGCYAMMVLFLCIITQLMPVKYYVILNTHLGSFHNTADNRTSEIPVR